MADAERGRDASGYMRFFPYETPYANQREAMDRISNTLESGRDVLFEGACGTGKTLSALVPALSYARETDRTVVITTNVHQQMRQFVTEARAVAAVEDLRAVVFRGKASMCHIDVGYEECQALRDATRDLVEAEADRQELERREQELLEASQEGDAEAAEARSAVVDELQSVEAEIEELREGAVCEHYYDNLADTAAAEAFQAWLADGVRTPDEIYEYAERQGLCGYELVKEGMEGVDLVVCNYHHLLDPHVREQFFRWLGRDPDDVVAVFDEAHNLEAAAREHATRTLTETTLESALDELADCDDGRAGRAENVIGAFREALVEVYDEALGFGGRERVGEDWEDLSVANEDRRDDLTLAFLETYTGDGIRGDLDTALELGAALDEKYQRAYREGETRTREECQTLQAAAFVDAWLDEGADAGQHPVVSVRRAEGTTEDGVYGRAELYSCLPGEVTTELFEEVHASVLMSATLRPFDVLGDVLGLEDPVTMAYGMTFPEERRRTYAVETPALFASQRDDPEVQEAVAGVLRDAVRFTPGSTLAFFPSYAEAERYRDLVAGTVDATVYVDEPGERAEDLRRELAAADGDALFTSLWGTLTEGVSFDGDDARTVAVVGVPYPRLDDRQEAVQAAYAEAFGEHGGDAGWRYAVEVPTIRKTRQALGRVLRSPEDFGVRLLVDGRYTEAASREMGKYAVRGTFPPEERRELIDVGPAKLKFAMLNFYSDLAAWEGSPPTP